MSEDKAQYKLSALSDHYAFSDFEAYLKGKKEDAKQRLCKADPKDCCTIAELQSQIRLVDIILNKLKN